MDYVLLAAVALILLGGLTAIGVGARTWNWGTIAAAMLVMLSATGYLYLAARLAARERAWTKAVTKYRTDLARVRHAEVPAAGGGIQTAPDQQPIAALAAERDRWSRALDRVRTWRGRSWPGASFQPPADAAPGRIELAAETYDEKANPIAAGAHLFVFDDAPLADGGVYLGEFLVEKSSYDDASKRHVLEVRATQPPSAHDKKRFDRDHPAVTVFEDLPVDRWLAFHETSKAAPKALADATLPPPTKRPREAVEEIHKQDDEVSRLVTDFFETFGRHDEPVPEDQQAEIIAKTKAGDEPPGKYWAVVRFTATHSMPAAAEAGEESNRDYETGAEAEFDLHTALELVDTLKKAEIVGIVERRPLADARGRLLGALIMPAKGGAESEIRTQGYAGLMRGLRAEKTALERSAENLATAIAGLEKQRSRVDTAAQELDEDLRSWQRDAAEATKLATAFEEETERTTEALAAAEAEIVASGRELNGLLGRLAAEIDRVAPPPERR